MNLDSIFTAAGSISGVLHEANATVNRAIDKAIDTIIPPLNLGRSRIITIFVGKNKRPYYYHQTILASKCPYFKACLKIEWQHKNGSEWKVDLEEFGTDEFEIAMDWIYGQSTPAHLFETKPPTMVESVRIYKLIDFLLLEDFKNQLVDETMEMCRREKTYCSFRTLMLFWKAELTHTKLFYWALRSCTRHFMRHPRHSDGTQPHSKISEICEIPILATMFMECIRDYNLAPWGDPNKDHPCTYHDHADGKRCDGYGQPSGGEPSGTQASNVQAPNSSQA